MKHTTLRIIGMSCPSCVADIEGVIQKLPGVKEASVSYATGTLHVIFDEQKIQEVVLAKTIKKLGYSTEPKEVDQSAHDDKKPHQMEHSMDHNMSHGEHTEQGNHDDHSEHSKPESEKLIMSKLYKFIFGLFVSFVLIAFDFFLVVPYEPEIGLVLALLVLVFTAKEFYTKGIPPFLLRGRPNMDTLVSLGITAALLYSAYNVLFTGLHELYFMDVAVISTFIILGRYLEAKSKGKANEAMQKLLSLGAKVAHRKTSSGMEDVAIEDIVAGDLLLIKPGEKIPVDGVITEGSAVIDESMITGESIPTEKSLGEQVIGATINSHTSFTIKATKVGENTLLAQMVRLIEQAQMHKAPIQRLVDTVSKYFVWAVVIIAILTFLSWYFVTGQVDQALVVTVSVLIIACPCALGLATPISLVVGTGIGAEHGILIKDAGALEKVHEIDTICFDKTGTITTGKPQVTEVIFHEVSEDQENAILSQVASIEQSSEHPLAHAVVRYATAQKTEIVNAKKVHSITGGGIQGEVGKVVIKVGSETFFEKETVAIPESLKKKADSLMETGKTVVYFALNDELKGAIAIQDIARDGAKAAIQHLKSQGIRTVMMTGDNEKVGKAIAAAVGIDEVHAGLQPDEKVHIIRGFQKAGHVVAMVGDGINDAPALATADIGIAIGTGTDIAIESGDLVLIHGDIAKAVDAIQLSKATIRNIKQNLFWAFAYNVVGIPIAALGLLNPMFSAFAMAISSLTVVSNALRLKRLQLQKRS